MKKQVWFQTNLGYYATKERLLQSRQMIGNGQDWKGMLTFHLKDYKDVTIQITTKGKLSVTYPEEISYQDVVEKLEPLLVKADYTPAKITSVIKEPFEPKNEGLLEQKVERAIKDLRLEIPQY